MERRRGDEVRRSKDKEKLLTILNQQRDEEDPKGLVLTQLHVDVQIVIREGSWREKEREGGKVSADGSGDRR
jgi:hypothetical protein